MNKHKAKYIFKDGQILENSSIFVSNGKITQQSGDYEVVDHGNALITPGFVNFHTHLQYTDLKKSNKNNFSDWIIDLIKQYFFWSRAKKIQSLENGLNETIKSGVTCVVNLGIEEEFIEVLNDKEIRSYVFLEAFADTEESSQKEFKRLMKCLKKYNTFNVGISPHSLYSAHPALWEKLIDSGVLIHTHLWESEDEMKLLSGQPSGIDKLRSFIRRKSFEPYNITPFDNLIAAHCNQRTFDEVRQFNIAHCPRSNMILHGKTLELSGDTSKVGLGTDSKFSNYDLNILHEAKLLKNNLSFTQIISILTDNPRRMLKLPMDCADFLVFKLNEGETPDCILDRDGPDEIYVNGKKYLQL